MMRAKFINEKFREEGDPIHDMGIGIMKFFKDALIQKGKQSSLSGSEKYFGDKAHTNESYTIYLILKNIVENNIGSAEEIMKAANDIIKERGHTKEGIESLKKVLKKHFYIDLYKSVNEKFTEEGDPIKDLGIGAKLYQTLKKWDVIQVKKQIGGGFNFPGVGDYILVTNVAKMKVRNKGSNSDTDITYVLFNKDKDKLLKTLKSKEINPDSERTWYMHQKFFDQHFNIIDKKELKESLNEKFAEDTDPIHDMGIGIYIKRNFTDKKDFFDKLVLFLPAILKEKTIPKDILLYGGYINHTYFIKIIDFLEKYWTFDNINIRTDFCEVYTWPEILRNILIAEGYKPYLNEKFTEDSDPIHDMGIGLIKEIKNWISINIVQRKTGDDRGHDYTINDFHINNDLSIDVYNRLDISWEDLEKAPNYIKFNHIKGDFYSWFNEEDTIKNNGPKKVDEDYEIFYRGTLKITEDIVRKYCKVKGEVHITKTT